MVEVHPDPDRARSDGDQSLDFKMAEQLIVAVRVPQAHKASGLPGFFIFARGETPQEVELAVREAHSRLELIIRSA